jgi:hypothetical protein
MRKLTIFRGRSPSTNVRGYVIDSAILERMDLIAA